MNQTISGKLRRSVRLAVHRACLRRHRESSTADNGGLEPEVSSALADAGDTLLSQDLVAQWVSEDEADFDRALLVSELVASQALPLSSNPPARPAALPAVPVESRPPARASTPPSITDLLDGMLAQDARRRR